MTHTRRRLLLGIYSHNTWGGMEHWMTGPSRTMRDGGAELWLRLAHGLPPNQGDVFRQARRFRRQPCVRY